MQAKIFEQTGSDGNLLAPKTISRAVFHNGETLYDMLENNVWSLKGKTLAFLGDSITYGVGASETSKCYVNHIATLTGATVLNYGVSATKLSKSSSTDTSSFISRVSSMYEGVDAVIVLGGVNDYQSMIEPLTCLGEFTDGTCEDKYTFYSGAFCLFKALHDKFVANGIPVVIVTPLHFGKVASTSMYVEYVVADDGTITESKHNSEYTYKQIVDAEKEVAMYFGMPVIDAYAESNMNPLVDSTMFDDNLHPSDAGHLRLAKFLIPRIKKIMSGM